MYFSSVFISLFLFSCRFTSPKLFATFAARIYMYEPYNPTYPY
ncbi:hypothetical protein HMPREF9446_03342 [Bacteroides fluxus YIT 12057]|uniref:Uncharacterized protein n=1 Tax=Bacteroides fluxus YIT 12057 TaxID=763034 RepID=F3PX55_9BACE|nr:hypothetical protein HMPREF9446_03342 [Bacteroides fluxus YIT 12057]